MSKSTMNMDRFKELLAAYGAAVERWPDEERHGAREFIQTNDDTNALLSEAAALDEALDAFQVKSLESIKNRILARLPEEVRRDLPDRFIDWLVPDPDHIGTWLWRPALIASVALTLGVIFGSTLSLDSVDDAGIWQEELYVMALNIEEMELQQ